MVVNGVTNDEDTEDEVKQRSDGGVLAVNVASLVAAPGTGRLGLGSSTLGEFLYEMQECKG